MKMLFLFSGNRKFQKLFGTIMILLRIKGVGVPERLTHRGHSSWRMSLSVIKKEALFLNHHTNCIAMFLCLNK